MSRKDYILIAAALKAASESVTGLERKGVQWAARDLAQALARDNARFNRERFLEAAGVRV